MQRPIKNTDKLIYGFFVLIILLSAILIKVTHSITNVQSLQVDYVNEVNEKVKKIAKYDVFDFSNGIYEINKEFQIEVELIENGEVEYSTLTNYGHKAVDKDSLDFLSQEELAVGENRTIWLGIYNNIDYSSIFNSTFMSVLLYIAIYSVFLGILLYFRKVDRNEINQLKHQLVTIGSNLRDSLSQSNKEQVLVLEDLPSREVVREEPILEESIVEVVEDVVIDLEDVEEVNEEKVDRVKNTFAGLKLKGFNKRDELVDNLDSVESSSTETKANNRFTSKYRYLSDNDED